MESEVLKKVQLIFLGLVVLIAICGCKKTEPIRPQGATSAVSATAEQTICPVEGGKINKNLYTVYKGKTVYFCCPRCRPEFEKNPEKYVSKLPQFAE